MQKKPQPRMVGVINCDLIFSTNYASSFLTSRYSINVSESDWLFKSTMNCIQLKLLHQRNTNQDQTYCDHLQLYH